MKNLWFTERETLLIVAALYKFKTTLEGSACSVLREVVE